MVVKGYKALNKDMTNNYGKTFNVGELYSIYNDLPVKSGKDGNGFHFATNIEDTLRYVHADSEEVTIVGVLGIGDIEYFDDEYYGYYDMCTCKDLYIAKIYSRQEIINYFLDLSHVDRVERLIKSYKLTQDEIELFINKFYDNNRIIKCIEYYQKNNKEAYSLKYTKQ